MLLLADIVSTEIFNWEKLMFGEEGRWFILEILFRTLVMYLVILVGLRLIGKRGVRQLSVFELVVIIGLGSAAGDPMFYKEVGLVAGIVVFITIIGAYRLTTYLTGKSKTLEKMIEGKPVCLLENGEFCFASFSKEDLAQDEFFSELRLKGVSQLGQVERGYLETSGAISLFFYPDEKVKPGLPILPHEFKQKLLHIPDPGLYACTFCGHTQELTVSGPHACEECKNDSWVKASQRRRVM